MISEEVAVHRLHRLQLADEELAGQAVQAVVGHAGHADLLQGSCAGMGHGEGLHSSVVHSTGGDGQVHEGHAEQAVHGQGVGVQADALLLVERYFCSCTWSMVQRATVAILLSWWTVSALLSSLLWYLAGYSA